MPETQLRQLFSTIGSAYMPATHRVWQEPAAMYSIMAPLSAGYPAAVQVMQVASLLSVHGTRMEPTPHDSAEHGMHSVPFCEGLKDTPDSQSALHDR